MIRLCRVGLVPLYSKLESRPIRRGADMVMPCSEPDCYNVGHAARRPANRHASVVRAGKPATTAHYRCLTGIISDEVCVAVQGA